MEDGKVQRPFHRPHSDLTGIEVFPNCRNAFEEPRKGRSSISAEVVPPRVQDRPRTVPM